MRLAHQYVELYILKDSIQIDDKDEPEPIIRQLRHFGSPRSKYMKRTLENFNLLLIEIKKAMNFFKHKIFYFETNTRGNA